MSDDQTTTSKAPSHYIYHVRESGQNTYWNRIGAVWPHKDGKGFNTEAELIPLTGRTVIRIASEKK
jgi:hypothetical protein